MSEPAEMVAEEARRKADQALLLARVFATVVTLAIGISCVLIGSAVRPLHEMFAVVGAELPAISKAVIGMPGVWVGGVLVLMVVTVSFVWAKGKTAVWMAGLGMLILTLGIPILLLAFVLPLVRITTEMGTM